MLRLRTDLRPFAGNEPGNRTLRVRNWWPGRWFITREEENGEEQLFLILENPDVEGGWQEVGKVLTAGSFISQPFIIGFRVTGNFRYNVLISKMDPRRNEYLRLEAAAAAAGGEVCGLSPDMIVDFVKRFHHYADLTALGRRELVDRVLRLVIGDNHIIQLDELMVVLKLLGNHAEPQHITFLLQSNADHKPDTESLAVVDIAPMLLRMDVMPTVPLDLMKRMKQAWATVDLIDPQGNGSLNAQQLKHMSNILGLARARREQLHASAAPCALPACDPCHGWSWLAHVPSLSCVPFRAAGVEEQGDCFDPAHAAGQGEEEDPSGRRALP